MKSDALRERNTRRRKRQEATKDSDDEPPRRKKRRSNFDDYFQDLLVYKQKHGNLNSLSCNDQRLYNWFQKVREGRTKDERKRLDVVGFCETRSEKEHRSWNEQFEKLKAYKEQHGNCVVPQKFQADPSLGKWVCNQRRAYKNEVLSEDREGKLDSICFEWQSERAKRREYKYGTIVGDIQWRQQYEKLVEYMQTHGHCIVPETYPNDKFLGIWVKNQRRRYTDNIMRQDRKELLDKHGFTWKHNSGCGRHGATTRTRQHELDMKWMNQYEKLVIFKQGHGDCLVPKNYEKDVPLVSLGAWVCTQRTRHGQNKMRQDRKQLLTKLGFVWNATAHRVCCLPAAAKKPAAVESASSDQRARDDSTFETGSQKPAEESPPSWDAMMKRLIHFKNEKGHPNVPPNFTKWGLGEWVETQRAIGRNEELHWGQAERLIEVGLTWWGEED
jgi:hypothetical protein